MNKLSSHNRIEIKSNYFSWDIIKSGIIFHWSQDTKILQ